MGISNSRYQPISENNRKIIEEESEKQKQKLKLEQEKERKNARERFYTRYAAAINIHKQLRIERRLNEIFKIKLPITSISDIQVNVYLFFTNITDKGCGLEYYKVELKIFANEHKQPADDIETQQLTNTPKLLYSYLLSSRCKNNYGHIGDNLEIDKYGDYYNDFGLQITIEKIHKYLHYFFTTLLPNLLVDTYAECFTHNSVINIKEDDYSTYLNDIPIPKFKISFEQTVYRCKVCNGQTKNSDCLCYFCGELREPTVPPHAPSLDEKKNV